MTMAILIAILLLLAMATVGRAACTVGVQPIERVEYCATSDTAGVCQWKLLPIDKISEFMFAEIGCVGRVRTGLIKVNGSEYLGRIIHKAGQSA